MMAILLLAGGSAVFALGARALWVLAGWSSRHPGRFPMRLASVLVASVAMGLLVYGIAFAPTEYHSPYTTMELVLSKASIPLFIVFPFVCTWGLAQILARRGISAQRTQTLATVLGALAVACAPIAIIVVSCGLTGPCF